MSDELTTDKVYVEVVMDLQTQLETLRAELIAARVDAADSAGRLRDALAERDEAQAKIAAMEQCYRAAMGAGEALRRERDALERNRDLWKQATESEYLMRRDAETHRDAARPLLEDAHMWLGSSEEPPYVQVEELRKRINEWLEAGHE